MERFDIFNAKQNKDQEPVPSVETAEPPHPPPTVNGHTKRVTETRSPSSARPKREADDSDLSDVVDKAPPRKKRKESSVEDDAAFAARLQAEEDRAARPTRGGTSRKAAPSKKKKVPRKKTADKVTGSDDSEVEENGAKRKVNRETGFHKPMNLSTTASDFFNTPKLSRPQVTKQVWEYIKAHDLQDPGDKRYIVCDDKLKVLLKTDKVHMFQMTKILNTHLYNPED
ncbi:hypothetical protein LTR51_002606 [Lithohypha guttulata]|nr:hypothetical protein LTR51_002606 [Lithohypha guttulata]